MNLPYTPQMTFQIEEITKQKDWYYSKKFYVQGEVKQTE